MFRGIIKNIFSISDADFSHKLIRICGLKLRILKPENKKRVSVVDISSYKNITEIPPADGFLRDYQLCLLSILKEFDRVCSINNIQYWLSGGTLLGAIRHGGFIPWDDDIDVDMMREDYENFAKIFNASTNNPDLYCEIWRDNNSTATFILKIKHKKIKQAFLDIFPHDFYIKKVHGTEKKYLNFKIVLIRKLLRINPLRTENISDLKQQIEYLTQNIINQGEKINKNDKPAIHWGLDFPHRWKNWIYDYEQIFPLKKTKFENIEFFVPNDADFMLKNMYGEYMSLPKKIYPKHTDINSFTPEEVKEIVKIANEVRQCQN